ncbi:hypothetical protein CUPS3778_03790 [Campylobacter upsaliensis]|uniref:hypothetical protein n=1 Tax=Campylobacter upsaliensis TaxID=28080 RepID=UPI00214A0684|nr:hypothetical protein [Campylobacter upsaliensis]MCR2124156.1 hypothetical protein [Campylobacter upsaliensis]
MITSSAKKYPLLGTHFILDEEKILKEDKYDLEKIYKAIDEMAEHSEMVKIDKNTYHCKGDENDLGCLGTFVYTNLIKCDWFTLNVKEWTWLSEKEGDETLIGDDMGIWK